MGILVWIEIAILKVQACSLYFLSCRVMLSDEIEIQKEMYWVKHVNPMS